MLKVCVDFHYSSNFPYSDTKGQVSLFRHMKISTQDKLWHWCCTISAVTNVKMLGLFPFSSLFISCSVCIKHYSLIQVLLTHVVLHAGINKVIEALKINEL